MNNKTNKKPNKFITGFLVFLFKPIFKYYFNFKYDRTQIEGLEGPAIFLSNHTSALDVFLMGLSAYPFSVNYVAGYEWFQKPVLRFLLKQLKAIPKFQYQLDLQSIKEMFSVVEQKQILGLFPSGRLSSDGLSSDLNVNVAKLIKMLKAPVYFFKINGSYMSLPKWASKPRRGLIDASYKLILTVEQLNNLSIDNITKIINDNNSYDEYNWTNSKRVEFKGRKLAERLENILYLCPRCKQEYTLKTINNSISCTCGLHTEIDSYGNFKSGFEFSNPREWNTFQRKEVKQSFLDNKLVLIDECSVEVSTTKDLSKTRLGLGIVTLIDNNIILRLSNKEEIKISLVGIESLPFKSGKNFEIANGSSIYTFNLTNGAATAKWSQAVEIINEVNKNVRK
jgi:1-acyl-sn-glycerol-3-phosphate acyltransferase